MAPGGDPDPGVVATFLAAVADCTWSSNHLVDPLTGAARYPAVGPSRVFSAGQWVLASLGDTLAQSTYDLLKTATANADGSFTAATGVRYWLADQAGVATPVLA